MIKAIARINKRLFLFFGETDMKIRSRHRFFAALCFIVVLLCGCFSESAVSELILSPQSIELCVGDTVFLSVEGRSAIDPDALSRRGVEFFCRAENGTAAFRVDENGVLTALSPGIGNVRAVTRDGKVSSRAVTVIVRDADGQNPAHLF